jgi:hypothetical protein
MVFPPNDQWASWRFIEFSEGWFQKMSDHLTYWAKALSPWVVLGVSDVVLEAANKVRLIYFRLN